MKIRHEKEKLNATAVKIESYWPIDPVTDEVEKVRLLVLPAANEKC